ncbi:hypothetical protein [Paenibacillus abyssi]|uniref:Glycosyl hydrolases family 2 sugar binding domain-containing protein n=1 Tax=Paenibacillus abyssi TaxID=1340531 RepID=A0A917CYT2_9BACL|nr:hypothetical protein [Paenibacillus abyssi]GGG00189.1 hypothetical protein GCM10010916_16790 [Paenibacillus abyssi]
MSLNDLRKAFTIPDPHFGPVPFWWWSADEVTEERVRWQLQKFRNGGLRNIGIINIAPTGPQYGSISDNPFYFSEDWWTMFEVAVREAERLDMHIWFYDQIGFSGSNFPARIVAENQNYSGYQLRRFADKEEIPEGAEILLEESDYYYVVIRQGFNWLDETACKLLLDKVHGEFERRFQHDLGKTIIGSFQDELPPLPLWSKEMPRLYMDRYNEDILQQLPALFENTPDSGDIRRRVYDLAADLAEKAFFIPISKWHEKYNMLLGCDQAGPARRADVHGAQRLYLDYFQTHRWYSSPGCDMDGEVKPHSSMVHLHGGKRVWLEGFHSSGWGGTLEETMHWLIPWFQGGTTLYSPHAVYFSTKGGWWEWASPDTGWRQPYFEHYHVFADTVSRVCSLLTQGTHIADIGVHYPSYAVTGYMSLNDGGGTEHPMSVANKMPHDALKHMQKVHENITGRWNRKDQDFLGALREVNRDFDVIDDSALEKAVIENGKLTINGETFSVLLLSGTTIMRKEAREKLQEWIHEGGLVIGVDILEGDPELEGMISFQSPIEAAQLVDNKLSKRVEGKGMFLQRQTDDADIFLLLPDNGRLIRMHKPTDPDTKVQTQATYRLRTPGKPQLWDPVLGNIYSLEYKRQGEWIEVEVDFTSWPAAIVVCPFNSSEDSDRDQSKYMSTKSLQHVSVELPSDDWRIKVVPTLDNTYGDFDLHGDHTMMPIEQRVVRVALENSESDGVEAGWHLPDYDDTKWISRLWSESAYWIASKKESFEQEDSWEVIYSNTLGDLSFKTWAGRMGRVPRRFLNLGKVKQGEAVWGKSNVIVEYPGEYWIRLESNAKITGSIDGEEIVWIGGPEEQTALVHLNKGANEIILKAEAVVTELIRVGIEINKQAKPALPKWIFTNKPNAKSSLVNYINHDQNIPIKSVRMVFAARGRVSLHVNGEKVTEHGDFNPYIRQGQEEVDVTSLWKQGKNEIKFELPEGGGEVLADGVVEYFNGETHIFCTGEDWVNEQNEKAAILHEAVLQFAETESLWLSDRPHPLPNVGWLMPNSVPDPKPLPFHLNPNAVGNPVWIRVPMPIGAKTLKIVCSGSARVWIGGEEVAVQDGIVKFPVQRAGSVASVRIEPDGPNTEADVLLAPIRFETAHAKGKLGDWRTALSLSHFSGAVEYETMFTVHDHSKAILDFGHIRGTAEVWVDNRPVGIRVWRPYLFDLGENLNSGSHRLRIRVTNTLGTHYQVGRPSNVIGGENLYWNSDKDQTGWTEDAAAGGLYGPVRIYQS